MGAGRCRNPAQLNAFCEWVSLMSLHLDRGQAANCQRCVGPPRTDCGRECVGSLHSSGRICQPCRRMWTYRCPICNSWGHSDAAPQRSSSWGGRARHASEVATYEPKSLLDLPLVSRGFDQRRARCNRCDAGCRSLKESRRDEGCDITASREREVCRLLVAAALEPLCTAECNAVHLTASLSLCAAVLCSA